MSTVIQFPGEADGRPLSQRVSQEVRALMGRHQVSQERLAAWLGVNQTAVSATHVASHSGRQRVDVHSVNATTSGEP